MISATCAICKSPFRDEIEKKDKKGKAAIVVNWARKRGISISYNSLARHRQNHLNGGEPSGNGNNGNGDVILLEMPAKKKRAVVEADEEPKTGNKIEPVTDELLLDAVRDMVYGKLKKGELELEINSAFKAIEIKYKIQEQSQSEKLMLEILSEIRSQELSKSSQETKC